MTEGFSFAGRLPSSKSLYIRALIAASYGADLSISGTSDSDDIDKVRRGLVSLEAGDKIDCGEGGTVLRLLALRASRIPGEHVLVGSQRLFSRPMSELTDVLTALGGTAEVSDRRLVVRSSGWQADRVLVDCSRSSQFATGVLINSWGLDGRLDIDLADLSVSAGYWEMTAGLVAALGMKSKGTATGIRVSPSEVTASRYDVEIDMGSAFAVAALAAVSGEARLVGWPEDSLQPDARFPELLSDMGVQVSAADGALLVARAEGLGGIVADVGRSPDLFPVLGALAGLAEGPSVIAGAPQLRFKESDRIAKVAELLRGMGRTVVERDDGIEVSGDVAPTDFAFDADQDHRMAMAAAVVRQAGVPVHIAGANSVTKSFGSFWDIAGWRP